MMPRDVICTAEGLMFNMGMEETTAYPWCHENTHALPSTIASAS